MHTVIRDGRGRFFVTSSRMSVEGGVLTISRLPRMAVLVLLVAVGFMSMPKCDLRIGLPGSPQSAHGGDRLKVGHAVLSVRLTLRQQGPCDGSHGRLSDQDPLVDWIENEEFDDGEGPGFGRLVFSLDDAEFAMNRILPPRSSSKQSPFAVDPGRVPPRLSFQIPLRC